MDNGIKLFVISPNIEKAILPDELAYTESRRFDGWNERKSDFTKLQLSLFI